MSLMQHVTPHATCICTSQLCLQNAEIEFTNTSNSKTKTGQTTITQTNWFRSVLHGCTQTRGNPIKVKPLKVGEKISPWGKNPNENWQWLWYRTANTTSVRSVIPSITFCSKNINIVVMTVWPYTIAKTFCGYHSSHNTWCGHASFYALKSSKCARNLNWRMQACLPGLQG